MATQCLLPTISCQRAVRKASEARSALDVHTSFTGRVHSFTNGK